VPRLHQEGLRRVCHCLHSVLCCGSRSFFSPWRPSASYLFGL
jgi:hypothetical protein